MSDYKNFIARELGIKVKKQKISEDVNADELEQGLEDEKAQNGGDDELAKKIALNHLKDDDKFYSKTNPKEPSARDRMMSPTAISPNVLAIAVRGSSTGGLPSGADQTGISPSTPTGRLGGYEKISIAKDNSEIVDKTPSNSTINSSSPKADDSNVVGGNGDSHPHQTQNNTDEPPQAVTGASDEKPELGNFIKDLEPEGDMDLKASAPQGIDVDVAEDKNANGEPNDNHEKEDLKEQSQKVSTDLLEEVRKTLSEKALQGKMNSKESELFRTITEVLAKRGFGLEKKLFGKKTMLETAGVPIKESRCEDYPCCGHEAGGCPDEDGTQRCTCGAKLPKGSRYSICQGCLNRGNSEDHDDRMDEYKSMLATNEVKLPKKNLKKKSLNEDKLPLEQRLDAWAQDKTGEYIQLDDDGSARYIAHGRAMETIAPKGTAPSWKFRLIRDWFKKSGISLNIWHVNERGNLEMYTSSGTPLGGLA